MNKLYESRLLRLAAELLEKPLDKDGIQLTESAKSALSADEQEKLKEKLANSELAEFITLFEERKKIACLVTLDMGCGNCSMARWFPFLYSDQISLIELDTGLLDENGAEMRDISLKSIIGYVNPDDYVIGERAIHGTSGIAQNFKRMPEPSYIEWVPNSLQVPALNYTDDSLEEREHTVEKVWGDFLEKMIGAGIAGLQRQKWLDPEINKDNILLVVAHPSSEDWARAEVLDLYKEMISRHTGISRHRILTFSESKAAMQFFRYRDIGKTNAIDFDKGVLIVDLGASTIDVEYLSGQTKDPYECSLTMAGRNVDWVLGRDLLKQRFGEAALAGCSPDALPDDDFFVDRSSLLGMKPQFEFFARHTKEDVSRNIALGYDEDAVMTCSISEDETEYGYQMSIGYLKHLLRTIPIRADYPMDVAQYYHAQHGGTKNQGLVTSISQSWYDHFETLMRFVLDTLNRSGRSLGCILVTGGTSNLPGVEEVIGQALKASGIDEQDVEIHMFKGESDYESCVPVGSCRYVRAVWSNLDRMKAFEESLPDKVKQDLLDHHEAIDEAIANAVIDTFQDALNWWAALERGNAVGPGNKFRNKDVPETTFDKLTIKVYEKVGEIKLDDVIKKGIEDMSRRANEHMVKTKDAVDTLLNELANTDYTAPVPIKLEGITLDRAEINAYLGGFIVENYLSAFEDYASAREKRWIGWYHLKTDDQLSDDLRKRIAERFFDEHEKKGKEHRYRIKQEISSYVTEAIKKAMGRHGDFGITDQLLDDLVDHIKTALYLVKK